jgi:hypothetical protein
MKVVVEMLTTAGQVVSLAAESHDRIASLVSEGTCPLIHRDERGERIHRLRPIMIGADSWGQCTCGTSWRLASLE